MKELVKEEPLLSYKVVQVEEGDELNGRQVGDIYCAVKVHKWSSDADGNLFPDGTVNEWNFGDNEDVAKAKVQTIIQSYLQGMEFVQAEVRRVFAEQEDEA